MAKRVVAGVWVRTTRLPTVPRGTARVPSRTQQDEQGLPRPTRGLDGHLPTARQAGRQHPTLIWLGTWAPCSTSTLGSWVFSPFQIPSPSQDTTGTWRLRISHWSLCTDNTTSRKILSSPVQQDDDKFAINFRWRRDTNIYHLLIKRSINTTIQELFCCAGTEINISARNHSHCSFHHDKKHYTRHSWEVSKVRSFPRLHSSLIPSPNVRL